MDYQKVLKLYKEIGETPLECLERFRADNILYKDLPMTYAGRLDPMAEGLLLVLVGEECKKKEEYLALDKEYEGEVLFGFKTDTGDLLGLPQVIPTGLQVKSFKSKVLSNEVGVVARGLIGRSLRKYPMFSSKTVSGKPLWQWAREDEEVEVPERESEVYSFDITDCSSEPYSSILQKTRIDVGKVRGDFRQEEILERWREILEESDGEVLICKFKTKVSSGTYIRVLAEELGEKLGTGGVLYSLKRSKVGEFIY